MNFRFFLTLKPLIISALLTGCAKVIPEKGFPGDIIPSTNQFEFSVHKEAPGIKALYLGCGHIILKFKNEAIVFDPFFSTHGLLDGSLKTNADAFERYKEILTEQRTDLKSTGSVWIAHTHYDHMLDLPKLIQEGVIPKTATIYGSNFGDSILTNFLHDRTYHSLLRNETYEPGKLPVPPFIQASQSIRVLPIRSNHAAHFKFLGIPVHLMKGDLKQGYFKNHLTTDESTTKRKRWKEGCTYSFLVDFMEGETIAYRLFIQSSSSQHPLGSPPESLLKDRGVDVAFLCVASFSKAKDYPVKILNDLKPNKIVWIHWEDFFGKPLEFKEAKLIRLTNFKVFGKRLQNSDFKPLPENQVMPRPGTMISIH